MPPPTEPERSSPPGVLDAAAPAERRRRLSVSADDALTLLPGVLVVFFSFQAGGYFPGSTGLAAGALAILLALRATLASRPFASVGAPVVVAGSALAALAVWQLVSASWSDATARALLDFNRTLLYGLAFLLCATVAWSPRRLSLAIRGLALACFAVALAGWLSRVAPDVFPISPADAAERLSFPLTYWNAQGLIAALGVVLAVHLGCSVREPAWVRALGCAAVPIVASSLFLTLSRGAVLATAAGLAAYVVLYRSRGLLFGLLCAGLPAAAAVALTYGADKLNTDDYLTPAGVAQGHDVLTGVALCTLVALLGRAVFARWVDRPLHQIALPPRARTPVRTAAWLAAAAVLVAGPLALGAPERLERAYHGFVENQAVESADERDRLLDSANTGRMDNWRVAVDAFRAQPLRGTGAGTYEPYWNEHREIDLKVTDGHSVYLETLGELGVVGLGLLAVALLAIGGAALWRGARRRQAGGIDTSADAVVVALLVAWGVQAGVDWMWELPAVTIGAFALGGIALAARVGDGAPAGPGRTLRVAVGLGCLALAVLPLQAARSQAALDDGIQAFHTLPRSCPKVIDAGLASLEAMPSRAEPWEIIAYCNIGVGQPALAVQAAENAVARDPRQWTYRYAQALVVGATGGDPRPAARKALALNPRSEMARDAVKRFNAAKRSRWRAVANRLPLPQD